MKIVKWLKKVAENINFLEESKIQANSLFGNISAECNNNTLYSADPDILDKIFNNVQIKKEIKSLENEPINYIEFIKILRLGMRIGAYYEIADHYKHNYEYAKSLIDREPWY